MIDWHETLSAIGGILLSMSYGFAMGFMVGDFLAYKKMAKKKREQEEAEKQAQMWNDYLEAVKGGQNAK